MPDPETVRRALARLARGEAPRLPAPPPRHRPTADAGRRGPADPEADRRTAAGDEADEEQRPTGTDESDTRRSGPAFAPGEVRAVVGAAADAVEDLDAAAGFADDVGRDRLEAAVAAARQRDDHDLARRGERALAAFEWIRRAADPSAGDTPEGDPSTGDTSTRDTSAPVAEPL